MDTTVQHSSGPKHQDHILFHFCFIKIVFICAVLTQQKKEEGGNIQRFPFSRLQYFDQFVHAFYSKILTNRNEILKPYHLLLVMLLPIITISNLLMGNSY